MHIKWLDFLLWKQKWKYKSWKKHCRVFFPWYLNFKWFINMVKSIWHDWMTKQEGSIENRQPLCWLFRNVKKNIYAYPDRSVLTCTIWHTSRVRNFESITWSIPQRQRGSIVCETIVYFYIILLQVIKRKWLWYLIKTKYSKIKIWYALLLARLKLKKHFMGVFIPI